MEGEPKNEIRSGVKSYTKRTLNENIYSRAQGGGMITEKEENKKKGEKKK